MCGARVVGNYGWTPLQDTRTRKQFLSLMWGFCYKQGTTFSISVETLFRCRHTGVYYTQFPVTSMPLIKRFNYVMWWCIVRKITQRMVKNEKALRNDRELVSVVPRCVSSASTPRTSSYALIPLMRICVSPTKTVSIARRRPHHNVGEASRLFLIVLLRLCTGRE